MLDTYRAVLTRPGTLRFSLAALVGRMPISMMGVGIVLLVSGVTGSYGRAGTLAAACVLAQAAFALFQGRLVDRLGQGRVLPAAIGLWAAMVLLLVVAVMRGWPDVVALVVAAVAGVALPQTGSCVRARWAHALGGTRELQTAFAWESVLDEVVFVIGPILVTFASTDWHPAAGLLCAVVLGLSGTLWLASQRSTEPPVHAAAGDGAHVPMPWAVLARLLLVLTAMGVLFGSAEVATVAFADAHGRKDLAGVLLALWAFGSLLAGLVVGVIAWRSGPEWRVRCGAVAITVAFALLPWSDSLVLTAALLFVAGFSISPLLIGAMTLVERVAPPGRLTETMGLMTAGMAGGVALGAAAAGRVVDAYGAADSYLVPLVAGGVATLGSLFVRS